MNLKFASYFGAHQSLMALTYIQIWNMMDTAKQVVNNCERTAKHDKTRCEQYHNGGLDIIFRSHPKSISRLGLECV